MDEPTERRFPHLAFLWPALAAASANEIAGSFAKQFAGLAFGAPRSPAASGPKWATPNRIALELKTVRLRDFTVTDDGRPTLLCAPFALHGAAVTDFARGHSLVAALRGAGLRRLFVTDWRSASTDMRFLAIDDYLADLNVLVDQLGGNVDLVGLCQGGWLSLLYAARFPDKVGRLVLAGAPIDIAAARSGLSAIVDASPLALFQELVKLGEGRVFGHKMLAMWGPEKLDRNDIQQVLQTPEPLGSAAFARLEKDFHAWHAWTVDLPGTYYLEVIERLYKRNDIATGRFLALGQTVDLAKMRSPLFLLAARDDELVAPAQVLAAARLVGTAPHLIRQETAPCRHVGLFMGKDTLETYWPRIARWLTGSENKAR